MEDIVTEVISIDFSELAEKSFAALKMHKRVDSKSLKAINNDFLRKFYNSRITMKSVTLANMFRKSVYKCANHLPKRTKASVIQTFYDFIALDGSVLIDDPIDGYINSEILMQERHNEEK